MEPMFPPSLRFLLLPLICVPFLLLWYCKFRNHDSREFSVSNSRMSVSNQRNSSNPFEIQTLCSFHRVSSSIDFLFMGRQDIVN